VHYLQVPPDFYIPDFDEDLQNPDERIDRKENFFPSLYSLYWLGAIILFFNVVILFPEHTQDKHIQRDDEYYEGDNDNDHQMDLPWR
jgi:histone deacetylase 1/2